MKPYLHGLLDVLLLFGIGTGLAYSIDEPIFPAVITLLAVELYLSAKRLVELYMKPYPGEDK